MCICIYVFVFMFINIYICIYIHILYICIYIYIYKRRYINGRYQKIYERITKGNDGEKIYEEEKELSFLIN